VSKRRLPIIKRTYSPDDAACVRALEILLKQKKAAEGDGGEDDGKQSKEIPPDGSMQRR